MLGIHLVSKKIPGDSSRLSSEEKGKQDLPPIWIIGNWRNFIFFPFLLEKLKFLLKLFFASSVTRDFALRNGTPPRLFEVSFFFLSGFLTFILSGSKNKNPKFKTQNYHLADEIWIDSQNLLLLPRARMKVNCDYEGTSLAFRLSGFLAVTFALWENKTRTHLTSPYLSFVIELGERLLHVHGEGTWECQAGAGAK